MRMTLRFTGVTAKKNWRSVSTRRVQAVELSKPSGTYPCHPNTCPTRLAVGVFPLGRRSIRNYGAEKIGARTQNLPALSQISELRLSPLESMG